MKNLTFISAKFHLVGSGPLFKLSRALKSTTLASLPLWRGGVGQRAEGGWLSQSWDGWLLLQGQAQFHEEGEGSKTGRMGVREWAWLRAGTGCNKEFNRGHLP